MDAWLVAIHRGPTGKRWQLPPMGQIDIGRRDDCEVVLDDGFVGRRHARIVRQSTEDVISFFGTSSGASLDDRELELGHDLALRDGCELRIGAVYLRYFCGDDASTRSALTIEQLTMIDSLTRLRRGVPAGAARVSVGNIVPLRKRHGLIACDILHRRLARRLATLATGDAELGWSDDECFAIDPPEVARRLVVEAQLEPIYYNGEALSFELVIE